jgi:hypothetical protein
MKPVYWFYPALRPLRFLAEFLMFRGDDSESCCVLTTVPTVVCQNALDLAGLRAGGSSKEIL